MKKFFLHLFSDSNSINEKAIVGFIAFIMMIVFAIADIITGYVGKELVINEFIFDAFKWLVLGSFGIASVDKYINKTQGNTTDSSESTVAPSEDTYSNQNSNEEVI